MVLGHTQRLDGVAGPSEHEPTVPPIADGPRCSVHCVPSCAAMLLSVCGCVGVCVCIMWDKQSYVVVRCIHEDSALAVLSVKGAKDHAAAGSAIASICGTLVRCVCVRRLFVPKRIERTHV